MPTYYNASGAGEFLEFDGVTRTWGDGNDSNDGSTRILPKLTANNLEAVSSIAPGLGDEQVFNQGSYQFTNSGGRLLLPAGLNIVSAQKIKDAVSIEIVGSSQSQGFRVASASSDRALSIGYGLRLLSQGTTTRLFHVQQGGLGRYTVDLDCTLVMTDNLDWGIYTSGAQGPTTYNFGDNLEIESTSSGVSLTNAILIANANGLEVNFSDDSFNLNWTAGTSGSPVFNFESNEGQAIVSSYVTPKGTFNFNNTASCTLLYIDAPASQTKMLQKGSLNITLNNPSAQFTHFLFENTFSTQVDDLLMYRDLSDSSSVVNSNAQNGYGFLLGSDGDTDTRALSGYILNTSANLGAQSSGSIHGVMHGGCTAGARLINRVSGAGIGSITKNGDGNSLGNYILNLNATDGEYCFAKASDAGVFFRGDRCLISQDTSAILTVASDSGLQIANDPLFDGIQAIYGGGSFTSLVSRDSDSSGELSESSHDSIVIDSRIDLNQSAAWFRRIVTNYTIAESEALASNPFVNTLIGASENADEIAANDTALADEIIAIINADVGQLGTLSAGDEARIRDRVLSTSVLSILSDKSAIRSSVSPVIKPCIGRVI